MMKLGQVPPEAAHNDAMAHSTDGPVPHVSAELAGI